MHGPGVIGIGGGHSRLLERDQHFLGNIGVVGQGAGDGSETDTHGALEVPGAGVVGRGGISPARGSVSPGVVGLRAARKTWLHLNHISDFLLVASV